jgi:hypothetical protein
MFGRWPQRRLALALNRTAAVKCMFLPRVPFKSSVRIEGQDAQGWSGCYAIVLGQLCFRDQRQAVADPKRKLADVCYRARLTTASVVRFRFCRAHARQGRKPWRTFQRYHQVTSGPIRLRTSSVT